MFVTTPEYFHLANTSTVWTCSACTTPNRRKIYNSISVEDSSYSSLSTTNPEAPCSPCSSIGSPFATSSPIKDPAPPKAQKRKILRLISLNFQSNKNKVLETEVLVENSEPDIIVGTKTWLNNNIFSAELLPSTLNIFRRNRADSYGGLLIVVKNDLVCRPIFTSKDHELLCVRLQPTRRKSIIIGAYYRPPNTTCEDNARMAEAEISKVRSDNPKSYFWLTGDFNLPDIDWTTMSINSYLYPSKMSAEYTNIPGDCGVQQLVNTPTRGDKILDLFFTNNLFLVQRCKVIQGVGDHEAVLKDSLIQPLISKPVRKEIYSWNKVDITLLLQEVSNFVQDFIARPFTSVNIHWELFRDTSECQRTIRRAYQQYIDDIITPSASEIPKKFWSFIKCKKRGTITELRWTYNQRPTIQG
ncbi:uncharacterized protein [Magallana gigas]|uniref:uncharacterized protein n=1 Tax=Magallana gigas TaxID=29159 RepID=UPI0033428D69